MAYNTPKYHYITLPVITDYLQFRVRAWVVNLYLSFIGTKFLVAAMVVRTVLKYSLVVFSINQPINLFICLRLASTGGETAKNYVTSATNRYVAGRFVSPRFLDTCRMSVYV